MYFAHLDNLIKIYIEYLIKNTYIEKNKLNLLKVAVHSKYKVVTWNLIVNSFLFGLSGNFINSVGTYKIMSALSDQN